MLPLQPLRSHAPANPTNKPWAWRSSANRIAPRLCRFVTPGNPDSNLPGTALMLPGAAGAREIDQAKAVPGRAAVQQGAPRFEQATEQRVGIVRAGRAALQYIQDFAQ